MRKLHSVLVLLMFSFGVLYAQHNVETAMMNAVNTAFENINRSQSIAILHISGPQDLSAFLLGEIQHIMVTRGYTVVDRSEMDRIRSEQNLSLSGDVDDNTAVRIGKLAGAAMIVTGEIVGTGDLRRLRLKVLNTETAIIVGSASEPLIGSISSTSPRTDSADIERIRAEQYNQERARLEAERARQQARQEMEAESQRRIAEERRQRQEQKAAEKAEKVARRKAKPKIALSGGTTLAFVNEDYGLDIEPDFGFNIGLSYQRKFGKYVLEPGARFIGKSFETKLPEDHGTLLSFNTYIELFVKNGYDLGIFRPYGGIAGSQLIYGEYRTDTWISNGSTITSGVKNTTVSMNGVDVYWSAIIGFDIIGWREYFSIGVEYDFGLRPLFDQGSEFNTLLINLGILF